MCTLSAIRFGSKGEETVRIAFNRDELVTRPAGLPLVRKRAGERETITPIDPVSGGTWIGVNDAGVIIALLNVFAKPVSESWNRRKRGRYSRGTLIPRLLESRSAAEILDFFSPFPFDDYDPFRIVVFQNHEWGEVYRDGTESRITPLVPFTEPFFITSSGFGDHEAYRYRKKIFEAFFAQNPPDRELQDRFHRVESKESPQFGITMVRADAKTVSHTVIEASPTLAVVRHHKDWSPAERESFESMSLPLNAAAE